MRRARGYAEFAGGPDALRERKPVPDDFPVRERESDRDTHG
ncbi:hypothetical protein [Granulicoccus sp. GXG6511]